MKRVALFIGWLTLAASIFAQQVRVDITNIQGKIETRFFPLGSQHEWNTTAEQKLKKTGGDCSMFDVSELINSVRVGRNLDVYGASFNETSAIIHFRYRSYRLLEIVPFKVNTVCTINQPTSQEVAFDGGMFLTKGQPQNANSVSDGSAEEKVTFTLVD